ncbi:MAG TPA: SDR family oxidoreductase [Terriglobales bacterium]|nr:SDR family oxidoreductase [Terriglobales bacterium]
MRLKGKTAIVTGAGSGIGQACAQAFAREGSRVVLVGRRREYLKQTAANIQRDVLICEGDVSKITDVRRVYSQAMERFGGIEILVNCAAVLHAGTAETQTEEEWDETFNINVRGLWLMSREAILPMRKAGGGSIVNLSSVLGLMGARSRAAYSASKGAVTSLTKSMALDLAHEQIRVNCICPGIVETELVADFIRNSPDPELTRKRRTELHPLGRFGQPSDIANMAVYLASDESIWVTGAAMPVDGGYLAGKA